MANGNGSMVKAFGVAGVVIGLVGASFGVSASVGPKQRLDEHERRLLKTEETCAAFAIHDAAQTEAMKAVNEKLDKLLKAAGL